MKHILRAVPCCLLLAVTLIACPSYAAHGQTVVKAKAHPHAPLTPAQLARLVLPSVVRLTVLDAAGQPSVQGSGFVVGPNLIATNVHVISGAHAVIANFESGRSETVHGIVAIDVARDLVLVYADTSGIRPLPLMTDNTVQVGDAVAAMGSPEGLGGSMSTGIVSQVRKVGDTKILQTTAPISHGSSGGALVDMYGRVLGVTSFFMEGGQNLNFAYSAYYVQKLIPHKLVTYTSWAELEAYLKQHGTQTAAVPAPSSPAATIPTPATQTSAADTALYTNKPLAGLKGVAVVIEDIRPDAQNDGLSADTLKTDVELRLRKAGIMVYSTTGDPADTTGSYLYVRVNTFHDKTMPLYVYDIDVEVNEVVTLTRTVPVTAYASIWDTSNTGDVGESRLASLRNC